MSNYNLDQFDWEEERMLRIISKRTAHIYDSEKSGEIIDEIYKQFGEEEE